MFFYRFLPSLVFSQSLISLDLMEDFLMNAHKNRNSKDPFYTGRLTFIKRVFINIVGRTRADQ